MLRLVHPAPKGQGTDPPRGHRRTNPLTDTEQQRLRAALRNLRALYGTWACLAEVMGVSAGTLANIVSGRRSSPSTPRRAIPFPPLLANIVSGRCSSPGMRCAPPVPRAGERPKMKPLVIPKPEGPARELPKGRGWLRVVSSGGKARRAASGACENARSRCCVVIRARQNAAPPAAAQEDLFPDRLTDYFWTMAARVPAATAATAAMAARAVRISEDIVPVSEFKAQAAELLRRVSATGQPLVITQNGKAAGVLLSPAEFDRLSERARFVAAVDEGLANADAGRVREHQDVVARMKTRFGKKRER